jgi:hypothetical protein
MPLSFWGGDRIHIYEHVYQVAHIVRQDAERACQKFWKVSARA